MTQALAGRIALVTGASRGIGAAVAKRFAAAGAHVVLTARTVGGLEEVDDEILQATGDRATLLPLDLANLDQIDHIGPSLHQRFGRLDVVVGNAAAIGPLSPVGHITAKDWDRIMAVNLTANFRLMRTLDPVLRLSDAGRAIFVTCGVTASVHPYWGAYAASKAGLETLVRAYAGEVTKTKLRVNLLDPGIVATKLRAAGFPLEDAAKLRQPEDVAAGFLDLASSDSDRNGELVRLA
ncbi:MAG: putative Short-chain dehydrogenase/reductase [Rhodospirillales bacterium]|jgi:NAD(P)-dependent dehydrogenase (short-subunit alcohol dehydrogenase family)|nr:putative Short-chain dehydrogenase/reductase [Rhodospirillales bacterium]